MARVEFGGTRRSPLRAKWPEHAVVAMGEDHVYVVFHGGMGEPSAAVLELVRETFRASGRELVFEEH
ncbi:hypothetical protein EON82_24095 [bacterium]|nr:MAG: hypothetical protein EON82_24095 [bacterium]